MPRGRFCLILGGMACSAAFDRLNLILRKYQNLSRTAFDALIAGRTKGVSRNRYSVDDLYSPRRTVFFAFHTFNTTAFTVFHYLRLTRVSARTQRYRTGELFVDERQNMLRTLCNTDTAAGTFIVIDLRQSVRHNMNSVKGAGNLAVAEPDTAPIAFFGTVYRDFRSLTGLYADIIAFIAAYIVRPLTG